MNEILILLCLCIVYIISLVVGVLIWESIQLFIAYRKRRKWKNIIDDM